MFCISVVSVITFPFSLPILLSWRPSCGVWDLLVFGLWWSWICGLIDSIFFSPSPWLSSQVTSFCPGNQSRDSPLGSQPRQVELRGRGVAQKSPHAWPVCPPVLRSGAEQRVSWAWGLQPSGTAPNRCPHLNWSSLFCGGGSPWAAAGALQPCGELRAYDPGRIFCEFPTSAESSWSRQRVWKCVGALQDSEGLWSQQERPRLHGTSTQHTHTPTGRCAHTCKVHTHTLKCMHTANLAL